MPTEKLRLILVDPDPTVCAAFSAYFGGLPGVEIVNGCFEDVHEFDCIVSPSNSFGFATNGVEAAIIRFFGEPLRERIRNRIYDAYFGEQPVGTSMIIKTYHPDHPFVAHTPTMRVPMPVSLTDNAYQAMWAMLHAVRVFNASDTDHRKIRRLVCPSLCTITGQMAPSESVRQMALAYRFFIQPPTRTDWSVAFDRQDLIGRGGDFPMQPPAGTLSRKKL